MGGGNFHEMFFFLGTRIQLSPTLVNVVYMKLTNITSQCYLVYNTAKLYKFYC